MADIAVQQENTKTNIKDVDIWKRFDYFKDDLLRMDKKKFVKVLVKNYDNYYKIFIYYMGDVVYLNPPCNDIKILYFRKKRYFGRVGNPVCGILGGKDKIYTRKISIQIPTEYFCFYFDDCFFNDWMYIIPSHRIYDCDNKLLDKNKLPDVDDCKRICWYDFKSERRAYYVYEGRIIGGRECSDFDCIDPGSSDSNGSSDSDGSSDTNEKDD